MNTGQKIRYLRENRFGRGLTQEELCLELNKIAENLEKNKKGNVPFVMFPNALSKYETGKIDVSSIELIQALCIFFNISPSYFIVTRTPFIEELFELEVEHLEIKKIYLRKISDYRIKSLIEYKDEFICEEFAVRIPRASDEVINSKLDYLLITDVAIQPGLVDSFYIKVKTLKKEESTNIKVKSENSYMNGSYLIYFIKTKKLGIFEKFSKQSNFYVFENLNWKKIDYVKSVEFFTVGFIYSEEKIIEYEKTLNQVFNEQND